MGVHAITETVLSDTSLSIIEAKRAMIKSARRVILLADHSKFGPPAFFNIANTDVVTDLVTDGLAPQAALKDISSLGETTVHVV